MLPDYEQLRQFGQRAEDLSEPADAIQNMPGPLGDFDIEATNYLLNEGYVARMKGLLPKPKKQRHH